MVQRTEDATVGKAELYIRENLVAARQLLDASHKELTGSWDPADINASRARVIQFASNAAEHLFDINQVDGPDEAVRDAITAASNIMHEIHRLENSHPGIIGDARIEVAKTLLGINEALEGLQLRLDKPVSNTAASSIRFENWPVPGFEVDSHPALEYVASARTQLEAAAHKLAAPGLISGSARTVAARAARAAAHELSIALERDAEGEAGEATRAVLHDIIATADAFERDLLPGVTPRPVNGSVFAHSIQQLQEIEQQMRDATFVGFG